MKFLMCPPTYYDVLYAINPWMHDNTPVDKAMAHAQWGNLRQTMIDCGAVIAEMTPVPGLPDMVFTANAGIYHNNQLLLSHFKAEERQGEAMHFRRFFEAAGFSVIVPPKGLTFEGGGDALLTGNTLFAGYGFRTDRAYYETSPHFDDLRRIDCELVDPLFYHLDTCLCPLDAKTAIWYPSAFSTASQQRLRKSMDLIPVSTQEAKQLACNAVVIDRNIILPAGCDDLVETLTQRGYNVKVCDMSEFLKAGGACQCLTLCINT